MKTRILVYGDSNTWGSGAFGGRYEMKRQWPNILQRLLGDNYEVIQEGVCGRIAGNHNTEEPYKNGRIGFEIAMHAHMPVDCVVVALGTNDIKDKYDLSAEQIFSDLMWYKEFSEDLAKHDEDARPLKSILYVGIANYRVINNYFNADDKKAEAVNTFMQNSGIAFVKPDNLEHSEDGLHYTEKDHEKVAELVFKKLKEVEA
jgi:lysophospholipase L1-like esterase